MVINWKEKEDKIDKLFDDFKSIDDTYKIRNEDDIKSLGLEKMEELKRPSKEELEKTAKDSLAEYKDKSLSSIDDSYNSGINKVESTKDDKEHYYKNKMNDVTLKYDAQKKSATNALIGKGLGRSSIIINNAKAFDDKKLAEYKQLDQELTRTITSLEKERDLIQSQRDSALKSFDISYASRLTEKLTSINDELDKKQKEITKYNNEIAKKEADYRDKQLAEIDKHNEKYFDFIQKNGTSSVEVAKSKDKFEKALAFFDGMDRETALDYASSAIGLEEELGSYYAALVASLFNRD